MAHKLSPQQLESVFLQLRKIIAPYERGEIRALTNTEEKYDLWLVKPGLAIGGKRRNGVQFATLAVQGGYVGFYFMPVYTNPQIRESLPAGLLQLLKGKSCFHITVIDEYMMEWMQRALDIGYATYQQNGWLS